MPEPPHPPALGELAGLYGIQTSYRAVTGRFREATEPALLAALQALGAPVSGPGDVAGALRERQRFLTTRLAPPVAVTWGRRSARIDLRLTPSYDGPVRCRLVLENGEVREWGDPASKWPVETEEQAGRIKRVVRRMGVAGGLPFGYHRLTTSAAGATAETLLISAPRAAPGIEPLAPGEPVGKGWGGFVPVYALRSEQNWGIGDLRDLRALLEWLRSLGGRMAATLPFFATFYDEPFDPSPYSPATRLFWNEIHLDVTQIPELAASAEARDLVASRAVATELAALRALPAVDYLRVFPLKQRVLGLLSRAVSGERQRAFDAFAASDPLLESYARFRGACEKLGRPWGKWPAKKRAGTLSRADVDPDAYRYHRYVQWVMSEQLEALAESGGGPLYLDLPIGTNPGGFDVWSDPECFVATAAAGASPDIMFTKGQNWGFPPMHPDGLRATGYRYPAECFRRMLKYAGVLRIDHAMGLHRIFCIPPGVDSSDGVYIQYEADELYAVLVLEAHRAGALLLGEDLGTVPRYVRTAMDGHNLHHSYVVEYELAGGGKLRPSGPRDVASINTHDMATFASFWTGSDIGEWLALGLFDEAAVELEHSQREEARRLLIELLREEGLLPKRKTPQPADVLRACLAYLSAGPAPLLVVNLEDLWLELQPQNVPGTSTERPNWRRKAALTLEDMRASRDVVALLEEVERRRRTTGR